ncbi:hypothetical protein [Rhodopirellula sallentina]|uniref:Membrane protein n=1 Tax=Rhodopirellula sallentina SM41 TaxID=1263870 RepID=M5U2Q1_9BACT|nr:hypothetical protein [Rhodopirellula sallentina]EMI52141.1 membrane protein [Rhodopirellula sallentina SM41]
MKAPNPYQTSNFVDESASGDAETLTNKHPDEEVNGKAEEPIDTTSRRLTRIGQVVLATYFVLLFPVWLSMAMAVWSDTASDLVAFVRLNRGQFVLLGVLLVVGLVGGVGCSFTPRRERVSLWLANFLKILVIGAGGWVVLSGRSGNFSLNLMPLFLAVLFAMWMISEASVLGFLRATATRNNERAAMHACEVGIGCLAAAAGCFSAWALVKHSASASLLGLLLTGVTFSTAVAISIAIWVLRWFPIMRRSEIKS